MSEKYRYDLHVHTYKGSACAKSPAAELADFYKEKGYAGLVVTDHFYAGNTRVDRSLPWPEWLKGFKEGYEHMKARGDEIGLSVVYGWEYSFHGIDFLTFGLDNDWLLEHPEVKDMDIVDYLNLARGSGAYVIHAHPFFEAHYIPYIRLLPHHVDAVEVCNAPKRGFFNDRAMEYATAYENHVRYRTAASGQFHPGADRGASRQRTRSLSDGRINKGAGKAPFLGKEI